FGNRAAAILGKPGISAKDAADLASSGDQAALALFAEYSELLAAYMLNMVTLFYPEKIILTGSFAYAHPLFLQAAEDRLKELLALRLKTMPNFPKIRVSRLGNRAGLLGAAYVAFHKNYSAT